jgi:hypothetical protein
MSSKNYQIMLLLFILISVVFVSGSKMNEGMVGYERTFDYESEKAKMDRFNFINDTTGSNGSKGQYGEIMELIEIIRRDILDYNVCFSEKGEAEFKGASGATTSWQNDEYTTSEGISCKAYKSGSTRATKKGLIDAKINQLATKIRVFQTKMGTDYVKMPDSDIAKLLGIQDSEFTTLYGGWRTQISSDYNVAGKTSDVKTDSLNPKYIALRQAIVARLSDQSNAIKETRAELDMKLGELNQVGNSNAMVTKMTMDSTVYASLLWTVLATTLIAYIVSTA